MLTTVTPATVARPSTTDGLAVHVVADASLGMSAGKVAAQTFQACQRLYAAARTDTALADRLAAWEASGTKTIVYEATTAHVFDRVRAEAPHGETMVDEGVNEVAPDSPTVWASWPITRSEYPQVLRHKRVRMLRREAG